MNEDDILMHFDNIFKTDTLHNVRFDDMKLLLSFYNMFEDEFTRPNKAYQALSKQQISIANKLEHTLTDKQMALFEEYWEITSDMFTKENKQLFLFGYIVAKELAREGNLS